MNGELVVKRYAGVLYEVAQKRGILEEVLKDISTISVILKEPEIRNFCFKAGIKHQTKLEFITNAFIPYTGDLTGRLLTLMVTNDRLEALPFLESAFLEAKEMGDNSVSVTLETAETADNTLKELITKKMALRLNKKIALKTVVNPNIVGGFRILWQNRIIDMSVLGKIKKLKVLLQ